MRTPRRSFLMSLSVAFLASYAALDVSHFLYNALGRYGDYTRDRLDQMVNYGRLGHTLLKHGEVDDLTARLADARRLHQLDFYILKNKGQVISFGNARNDLRDIDANYTPGQLRIQDRSSYLALQQGDYRLALGINNARSQYLAYLVQENRLSLLLDILAVALMTSVLAYLFFRDVRELARALRRKGGPRYQRLRPRLLEARIMLEGIKSYEARVRHLSGERQVLRNQLASAVRAELDLGRKPPYQFRCTLVRTDINQFSTIYSTFPVEDFMAIINEFFARSSEVIARYGGYITGYLGDEIIYYFKDEDQEDSAAAALAATRDINAIAEELNGRTWFENGYAFRVKSAVAAGSLRFGLQVDEYALSGAVFVETVRILSQIDEKSENQVWLPARICRRLSLVCSTVSSKVVELKGLPGRIQLHRVASFSGPGELWDSLSVGSASALRYHLSPADVADGLARVREGVLRLASPAAGDSPGDDPDEIPRIRALAQALRALGEARIPYTDETVARRYRELLETLVERAGNATLGELSRLYSAAVSVSRKLVAGERFDSTLRDLLLRCAHARDARVVSNAVDAFIHFDPDGLEIPLLALTRHPNNRVAANSLVKAGMSKLDRGVFLGLRDLLRSERAERRASGAWAVGELVKFYLAADPVFFETHFSFRELLRSVQELAEDQDPQVQRQVRLALEKAQVSVSLEDLAQAS